MRWFGMDPAIEAEYQRAKAMLGSPDPALRAAAIPLLDAGCAAGHPGACFRRAELLLAAADPGQWAQGAALLRQAAGAGHARACFRLGLLHAQGANGVAADAAAAAAWCTRAAEAGLGVAQFNLGLLHAAGQGVPRDAAAAARWLRLAAANGVPEADGCLEVVYRGPDEARPRTWDEAETRASVALAHTDPEAPKSMRLAEYYVDPCLDFLQRQMRLQRSEVEDIVQQFFLELEEPLSRGMHRGEAWKRVLRNGYSNRGNGFRPLLGRALVNFARDWLRRRADRPRTAAVPPEELDADSHAARWLAMLEAFGAAVAPQRPDAARAVAVVRGVLVEDLDQAALADRLAVTTRTVRSSLRLGAELLRDWLARQVGTPPEGGRDALGEAVRGGIELIPAWLHNPSADKRRRLLLFLALASLHLDRRTPSDR